MVSDKKVHFVNLESERPLASTNEKMNPKLLRRPNSIQNYTAKIRIELSVLVWKQMISIEARVGATQDAIPPGFYQGTLRPVELYSPIIVNNGPAAILMGHGWLPITHWHAGQKGFTCQTNLSTVLAELTGTIIYVAKMKRVGRQPRA